MKERIKLLAEQAKKYALDAMIKITDKEQALKVYSETYDTKFAESIVRECLAQVARVDDMLEDDPAQKAAVAWVASSIANHFGVESQAQFDQAAAEFIATEDKKVASRYGYFPKLHPSEWQDK